MTSTITKFAHLQIPFEDVVKATNDFHDDNIIGFGGFSTTYRGRLMRSGRLMNIFARRFDCKHGKGDLKFLAEFSVLSDLKDTNDLVSIIGFCDDKNDKIIVTTDEARGSLKEHLDNVNLTWMQRLKISVGVARALSCLRFNEGLGYGVIHGFITSSMILLDENWEVFEVSIKQFSKDDHGDQAKGVMGYMDPSIEKTGSVTDKLDIYSMGFVLFEIMFEAKAFIQNEANDNLASVVRDHYENKTLEEIIHTHLWNQMSPGSLFQFLQTAYYCLNEDRASRPDVDDIVKELEKALDLQLRRENIGNNLEHLKIRLVDIKLATENFSEIYATASSKNRYTLYRVEFKYYEEENHSSLEWKSKGKHPKGHNNVVIKRFASHDMNTEKEFFTEFEILSGVKHPNIVTLLGFCVEGSEIILVTENLSNGYLGDYLGDCDDRDTLTWEKRLKICIDVANALNYLHFEMEDQKMIINRDIYSYNIKLDENWKAKIVAFGNSVFLPPNQADEALFTDKFGKLTHIDPEYHRTGKLKKESDVYSFGVVLFEILCGRKAHDPIYMESHKGLAHVARRSFSAGTLEEMIDPIIKKESGENLFVLHRGPYRDSLQTFIEIAYLCVGETQDQRPTMKFVVKELEKALFKLMEAQALRGSRRLAVDT